VARLNASALLELEDSELEFSVADYSPGSRPSWSDPGDGPEASASNIVAVLKHGKPWDFVTYDTATREYAAQNGMTTDAVDELVNERLLIAADERMSELWEDAQEYDPDCDD